MFLFNKAIEFVVLCQSNKAYYYCIGAIDLFFRGTLPHLSIRFNKA